MGLCLELGKQQNYRETIMGTINTAQNGPWLGAHGDGSCPYFSDKSQEKQGSPQLEQSEYCRLSHQHLGNDAFLLSTSSEPVIRLISQWSASDWGALLQLGQLGHPGKNNKCLKNWSHKEVTKHIFLIIPPCALQCCKSFLWVPFSSQIPLAQKR